MHSLSTGTSELRDSVAAILATYGARLLGLKHTRRPNFERLQPTGDGNFHGITAYVEFTNKGTFGTGADYLEDIYPRIAHLTRCVNHGLAEVDPRFASGEAGISLYPLCEHGGRIGDPLPKLTRPSWGRDILPIDQITVASPYYEALSRMFDIQYGVVTNNGTVIGPDGGILAALRVTAASYDRPMSVTELGSGGGSSAFSLSAIGKLSSYCGVDFSPDVKEHFSARVSPVLGGRGVKAAFRAGSCFDVALDTACDVLVVGVYYQAQPQLFRARGRQIADLVGSEGVVIAQTGMIEDPFITDILTGVAARAQEWPWFSTAYQVTSYFPYVAVAEMAQETILLATASLPRFQAMVESIGEQNGALIAIR